MAFEGLLQWTQAVARQSERVSAACDRQREAIYDAAARHENILALHTECHFFAVSAYKLIEHRKWIKRFGLCTAVDFRKIDGFSVKDIKDLRDMREHIIDYFRGDGFIPSRWVSETPEYKADASSLVGTMIGGRLDWVAFSAAAKRLLSALLAEPIPYPPPEILP